MLSNSCSAAAENVCPETGWLWLGLVSILLLCLVLFAAATNLVLLLVIIRSGLNPNLRAALTNISISVLLMMVPTSYRCLVGIVGLFSTVRPTKMISCALINASGVSAAMVTMSSLTGLALERTRTFLKAKAQANHEVRGATTGTVRAHCPSLQNNG